MSEPDLRANPYVGLRPFFDEDSPYFFGREQQTAELLDILRQHRFLGVVGSSGSGKSSLVRAGLLPALLGGFLVRDRDRWRTVQMKPGDGPIVNLAAALLEAVAQTPTPEVVAQLEKDLREDHTDAVLEFLKPRLESNANLFVLVDQFEEIFAFRGVAEDEGQPNLDSARRKERARRKAEAADFVDLLLELAEQRTLPIYVAITMRTDFLGDCDLFYGLPEALNRGRYLVPRMTREQLRDAVECPALLLGAEVAPRLMDHVLNELGDRFDRLPMLQHALLRTWDEWQRAGSAGPIDLRHFESAGGLEGALDQDAEGALQGLDIGTTARVFKRLTDTDLSQRRVRSPARISELMAAASVDRGTVEGIVHRFEEDGRSFVHPSADGKPDDPRVDISHESLIRQWDRLRNWVDDERRSRDHYSELVARARKWERGEAELLQGTELQLALDWREKAAPSPGWASRYYVADGDFDSAVDYLAESVQVRCNDLAQAELERRWRRLSPWILMAVVVTLGSIARALGVLKGGLPELGWEHLWDWLRDYATVGGFIAVGGTLVEGARRVHRRMAFPIILQGFVSSGGRSPVEAKAKAAKLQDAVVAHHTVYAGSFRRVAGYVIDWVCFLPLGVVVAFSIVDVAVGIPAPGEPDDSPWFFYVICLLFAFAWLYETLQIALIQQATLGMRAVGIFRTDLHGERLSFARASAWFGYRLLSYLGLGLGFLLQPYRSKRQTFHDWMAGTVVLRRPPPESKPVAPIRVPADA